MLIIAGLGNPGAKYANNRHNIGFMAVDEIAHCHSFSPWKSKFHSMIAEGKLAGEKILLVKPQTMMNLSGDAVGKAMRFYKLDASDILVLYDELDLAAGKARFKTGGGAGGHNGIKSIIAHCGEGFDRLRLGIGHPGEKARVNNHVLGDFAKSDQTWLEPLLQAIGLNAKMLATGQNSSFMNKLSLAVQDTRETKPRKQSHIHQARTGRTEEKTPKSGPMADLLKKLFGLDDK
ncbi:MAG: aminoacyl-tRNA hydrolase [Hyphomicrobiales bacterium]|nr:aminoacyl-tRNA hydrolase [Hyphomicrobiales bacterium]